MQSELCNTYSRLCFNGFVGLGAARILFFPVLNERFASWCYNIDCSTAQH